jgi:rhodanese-related sulfurtransferase
VGLGSFARALADGATVVDVREPSEYVSGHVPGARLMPLASVPVRSRELPKGRPVFVICGSGSRSRRAAELLSRDGIEAVSVNGGTGGWAGEGRPLVSGPRENAA